jgi:triosephosphate isomerase
MKQHQPLIIGNWKMNPTTVVEAKNIVTSLKTTTKKLTNAIIVIAPPALFILEVKKALGSSAIALGAQTMHEAPGGAQTGEQSASMLTLAGAAYVIIGHSERRAQGESDQQVNHKTLAALKAKITPVVCIGEHERDSQGNFFVHIEAQLVAVFKNIPATRYKDVVIAYEPIWAIGTGKTASAEDVFEMQLFVKKILTKHFGKVAAAKVRIIYGGSVNADNAQALFTAGGVSGFLVGGASLKADEFTKIIAATV